MQNLLKTLRQFFFQPRPAAHRSRRYERGMTLVEIMVVLVIMSLVTGVVGVSVFNALSGANVKATQTQIRQLSDALDIYRLQHRKYPSTAEGLQALTQSVNGAKPVMDSLPKDAWNNDFVYIYPGTNKPGSFDLMSYGEDGVQGGGDDISNWSTETK
jgi:general secretion pathway protein G